MEAPEYSRPVNMWWHPDGGLLICGGTPSNRGLNIFNSPLARGCFFLGFSTQSVVNQMINWKSSFRMFETHIWKKTTKIASQTVGKPAFVLMLHIFRHPLKLALTAKMGEWDQQCICLCHAVSFLVKRVILVEECIVILAYLWTFLGFCYFNVFLQASLLWIMGELAGWGSVAVAVGVSDSWQVTHDTGHVTHDT